MMAPLRHDRKAVRGSSLSGQSGEVNGSAPRLRTPAKPGAQAAPGAVSLPAPRLRVPDEPSLSTEDIAERIYQRELKALPEEVQQFARKHPAVEQLLRKRLERFLTGNTQLALMKQARPGKHPRLLRSLRRLWRDMGTSLEFATETDWVFLAEIMSWLNERPIHFGVVAFTFRHRWVFYPDFSIAGGWLRGNVIKPSSYTFSYERRVLRLAEEMLGAYTLSDKQARELLEIVKSLCHKLANVDLVRIVLHELLTYDYLILNGQHLINGGRQDLSLSEVYRFVWRNYYSERLARIRSVLPERKERLRSFLRMARYLPPLVLTNLDVFDPRITTGLAKGDSLKAYTNYAISKRMRKVLREPTEFRACLRDGMHWTHFLHLRSIGVSLLQMRAVGELLSLGYGMPYYREATAHVQRLPVAAEQLIQRLVEIGADLVEDQGLRLYLVHRITEDQAFSIRRRSLASLQRASHAYHEERALSRFRHRLDIPKSWPAVAYPEMEVEDYVFVELNAQIALAKEGYVLGHCVGGYAHGCAKGLYSVWSLRHEDAPKSPLITIQVNQSGQIVQARGKYNRLPKPAERAVIEQWAKLNGLSLLRC